MSAALDRIRVLYAEQADLYARAGHGERLYGDERKRMHELHALIEGAWKARRMEKMWERLARQKGDRCRECAQPLTPFVVGRIGGRWLAICESCRRQRISAGRQRQIAADRRRYAVL